MKRRLTTWRQLVLYPLFAALVSTGCGGDAGSADSTPDSKTKPVAVDNKTTAKAASPEKVLHTFLESARNGNRDDSRKMLTEKTIEQCAKHELDVNPPGSPSMTYKIGRVASAPQIEGGVFVESTWSEEFEDGIFEMEVLWAMRKDRAQWRICGMVLQIEEDGEPVCLDFENNPEQIAALMQPPIVQTPPQPNGNQQQPPTEVAREPLELENVLR